jgi:hypothetical protein
MQGLLDDDLAIPDQQVALLAPKGIKIGRVPVDVAGPISYKIIWNRRVVAFSGLLASLPATYCSTGASSQFSSPVCWSCLRGADAVQRVEPLTQQNQDFPE